MLIVHNHTMLDLMRSEYTSADIERIERLLADKGTLRFPPLKSGLFSAAMLQGDAEYTGYKAAWVRDNAHVGNALLVRGETDAAASCMRGLLRWFATQSDKMQRIVALGYGPQDQMERPHIRFDGETLSEIDETWYHAQNDALGYSLWLYCRLVAGGHLQPNAEDGAIVALLVLYLQSVAYWQDEDSGHWEEPPKIEASSIGPVVAGLRALRSLLQSDAGAASTFAHRGEALTEAFLDDLIITGEQAMARILPAECVQADPEKHRAHDAALLFLVYPLDVVDAGVANLILGDVLQHLKGEHGIRRYFSDKFWCRDYKSIPEEMRTVRSTEREAWWQETGRAPLKVGEEAQWCIFDPVVSAAYGRKYQRTGQPHYLRLQTYYFNRSLGQITGEDCPYGAFRCPELYFLQDGRYVPNDVVPLLWTQANLSLALHEMRVSLEG